MRSVSVGGRRGVHTAGASLVVACAGLLAACGAGAQVAVRMPANTSAPAAGPTATRSRTTVDPAPPALWNPTACEQAVNSMLAPAVTPLLAEEQSLMASVSSAALAAPSGGSDSIESSLASDQGALSQQEATFTAFPSEMCAKPAIQTVLGPLSPIDFANALLPYLRAAVSDQVTTVKTRANYMASLMANLELTPGVQRALVMTEVSSELGQALENGSRLASILAQMAYLMEAGLTVNPSGS
jgi:hypothetical protein